MYVLHYTVMRNDESVSEEQWEYESYIEANNAAKDLKKESCGNMWITNIRIDEIA